MGEGVSVQVHAETKSPCTVHSDKITPCTWTLRPKSLFPVHVEKACPPSYFFLYLLRSWLFKPIVFSIFRGFSFSILAFLTYSDSKAYTATGKKVIKIFEIRFLHCVPLCPLLERDERKNISDFATCLWFLQTQLRITTVHLIWCVNLYCVTDFKHCLNMQSTVESTLWRIVQKKVTYYYYFLLWMPWNNYCCRDNLSGGCLHWLVEVSKDTSNFHVHLLQ